MKTQTKQDMLQYDATEQEADAALALFELLRPALRVKRENGRIETTAGDKSILGFYRTIRDFVITNESEQTK